MGGGDDESTDDTEGEVGEPDVTDNPYDSIGPAIDSSESEGASNVTERGRVEIDDEGNVVETYQGVHEVGGRHDGEATARGEESRGGEVTRACARGRDSDGQFIPGNQEARGHGRGRPPAGETPRDRLARVSSAKQVKQERARLNDIILSGTPTQAMEAFRLLYGPGTPGRKDRGAPREPASQRQEPVFEIPDVPVHNRPDDDGVELQPGGLG